MKLCNKTYQAIFALLRAGLWEQNVRLQQSESIDYIEIFDIAEKQGVTGLIAAGLENMQEVKAPKDILLQFVGQTLQLEQRNTAMNAFIADLVNKMIVAGIHTLMVKGQGIAQCYERPLWRPSGDVDFLMDDENFRKADEFLTPISSYRKTGGRYSKEIGLGIQSWTVELHASLRTGLSGKVDREVDAVQEETFKNNKVRIWHNGGKDVLLPAPDEDVFFVFTHFIKHFYKEGMSLRQMCDWCRLLWTYRNKIDGSLLEERLRRTGLMSEWKVFAAVAVEYLGMPVDAMPMYDENDNHNLKKKERLVEYLLKESHGKVSDTYGVAKVFPWHTIKFLPSIFLNVNGLKIKERLFT